MIAPEFVNPPREFSLMPFWFWNDALDEAEIVRQIADMEAHGVYGFIIHPRVGLPHDIGWMSDRMLHFMRVAIEAAKQRDMTVILYDEGMYPSGSSSGQVVAQNPAYQCRCLACVEGNEENLSSSPLSHVVAVVERANGQKVTVVNRPLDAVIRGLHYLNEGVPDEPLREQSPPAADILNPDAVATFLRLVYDGYFEALGAYFGNPIQAIFTDEPGVLGRPRERNIWPGTTGILEYVNTLLGYDFTPHLPALWYDDEPDAARYREDYTRAIEHRLEETFYRQLYTWCEKHHIALTGHPARGDQIGFLRYFHIPGQDLVWRWVLPGDTALEGPESTQGKCSASAALHLGRRRNSNECFGAYGHDFTWDEMKWLVDWCFVRGVNMLYPHAFYYSMRGPRKDERPPDVGPNSPWWDNYKLFADYCRRLCWLNTNDTANRPEHICHIAILSEAINLPWSAAKICLQNQRDFNYLELRHLWEDAEVTPEGVFIAGMHYQVLIADSLTEIPAQAQQAIQTLYNAKRIINWQSKDVCATAPIQSEDALIRAIDQRVPPDLNTTSPTPDLRYRHLLKHNTHYYILSNEGLAPLKTTLEISAPGHMTWLDPYTVTETQAELPLQLTLAPYTLCILRVSS